MIPYVEIIGKYTLKPFALIEPSECWFELSYYDQGEFQIYAPANLINIQALKMGNYAKIPNKPYLWVIKSVEYTFNASGSRMISAKGYEAKWLIGQRIIPNPFDLPTDLKKAVYKLVANNLGDPSLCDQQGSADFWAGGANSYRYIPNFKPVKPTFNITIEQTQATRGNLWEFLSNLLRTNKCGSYCSFVDGKILFNAIQGVDRSNYILFSQSMDNLITSTYYENSEERKTYCQVVSVFNENDQEKTYIEQYPDTEESHPTTGIDRHEITIQSNISTKYTDASGQEQEVAPTSDTYKGWQRQEGKNQLAEKILVREFNADIDLKYSQYKFEEDFFIGDLVKVRDEFFGYEASARIIKYTIKQDAGGYGEEAEYQTE